MGDTVTAMKEPPPGSEAEIAVIKADPVAYMNKSLVEARKVKTARMNFQRQDRLGLVPELRPLERMRTDFRETPFSVRFTWIDKDSEYLQAVYVEGTNDNKVALLPRTGLFGGKPSVVSYPVNFAVAFGKSKKPITDFGPRLMLERLFDRIEKAKPFGGAKIQHVGVAKVGPGNEECHHIELLFPKKDEFPCKLLDLYVNINSRLPVAVYLWLTEEERKRTDQTLDAMYIYGEMQPNVTLSENDFVIDAHPKPKETAPRKKKKDGNSKQGANATSAPSGK
jgi:hypothetical protein